MGCYSPVLRVMKREWSTISKIRRICQPRDVIPEFPDWNRNGQYCIKYFPAYGSDITNSLTAQLCKNRHLSMWHLKKLLAANIQTATSHAVEQWLFNKTCNIIILKHNHLFMGLFYTFLWYSESFKTGNIGLALKMVRQI